MNKTSTTLLSAGY